MDVVGTQDKKLVLRHDITLDDSTNVKQLVKDGKFKDKHRKTAYASLQPHHSLPGACSVASFTQHFALPLHTLRRAKQLRCFTLYPCTVDASDIDLLLAFPQQSINAQCCRLVDGVNMTGYFVSDFKLDEIHNMSAIQVRSPIALSSDETVDMRFMAVLLAQCVAVSQLSSSLSVCLSLNICAYLAHMIPSVNSFGFE